MKKIILLGILIGQLAMGCDDPLKALTESQDSLTTATEYFVDGSSEKDVYEALDKLEKSETIFEQNRKTILHILTEHNEIDKETSTSLYNSYKSVDNILSDIRTMKSIYNKKRLYKEIGYDY